MKNESAAMVPAMKNNNMRTRQTMESSGGSTRRRAPAILGASDGTMQFTTLQSPQQQGGNQPQHEELPQEVAAETKSATADVNEQDGAAITEFKNLKEEVEKLKEQEEIQVRDGQDDSENDEQQFHEIHYGEDTGPSLGIFILSSDDEHSSSVEVDELRDGEEDETSDKPYQIFPSRPHHGKVSEENEVTGNGNYDSQQGGGGSSSSNTGSNSNTGLTPEESQLRDVLNNVKQLGQSVNISIHQKTSSEKNGANDPMRAPSNFAFYNPNPGDAGNPNGGEPQAPPRANDGPTNQPTEFGKRNCKATNGSFGDNRQARAAGGITLQFQYELTTDATPGGPFQRASLYNDILPALEGAMTTSMLPSFFSDECMQILTSGSSSRRKKKRGRFLRGGGEEEQDQLQLFNGFDLEEDPVFGYEHQHRRLNRVIGIDSDPMDFPLNGEACSGNYVPPNPTIVPKCYVMEGALTIYFPENFDFKKLLPGAQLTALNTLKEGMEFGTIAQIAHPAILGLTFLESSYSLRPIMPGGGGDTPKAVAPEPSSEGGGGSIGLIAGVIGVLVVFVCIAGCFFRYRLKQEQSKLEAMMRAMRRDDESTSKKKKKKRKGKNLDDTDHSSEGTPVDPTSLALLNAYKTENQDDADDEDNLTAREREIHQRLKKRRKSKKKLRRASVNDGSFSTIDTDSTEDSQLRNSIGNSIETASETLGSKTTTSSDSTDDSGSESSTTMDSNTFHTTSTGTSDDGTTTSDSNTDGGTTSSTTTSDDGTDDSEEEDAFDMNDDHFNVGGANKFSNGAMKGQRRKKKGPKSNLIMTGDDDDDGSVGTEATGATEAVSNVIRGGAYGGGGFSGGASAAPSVDFSAATEVMGNVGRGGGRYGGASEWGGGGFSGEASAAPSVDFSAATEAMGNVGRGRGGASNWGGGGFSGGASAAPSVDFSAATEAMGNVGRARGGPSRFSGAGSAAPSVDFSAATEAMGNRRRARGGSAGPGASVAMSAATEAVKNTGRKKAQPTEGVGQLTFSEF